MFIVTTFYFIGGTFFYTTIIRVRIIATRIITMITGFIITLIVIITRC